MAYDRLVGDYGKPLTVVVGGADSLSGGTAVIKFRKPDGTNVTKTGSLDAGTRTISYTWESGVIDQPGEWWAWGQVTVGATVSHALPVSIIVGPAP
jgi:hypothetical protein